MADIRKANMDAGNYFFSRQTMKFFGDVMKNFKVVHLKGHVFIERVKNGHKFPKTLNKVGDLRHFNTETGDISSPLNAEKLTAIFGA
jgi:phage-related protein